MPMIDDAMATYEAAARMVSRLLDCRTDLLSSGLAVLSNQPSVHLSGGYRDVGDALGICLPADSRATISRVSTADAPAAVPTAAEVLTSDLEWMTFEGWVAVADARVCFIEMDVQADRQITADVFERKIGADGKFEDSPPVEWSLPRSGPAVFEMPLDPSFEGRRKIVLHLRRPPERMILHRLAVTALR